jgi:opacity protein-like surface antigen
LNLNYAVTARISASLALIYSNGGNGNSNQISSGSLGGSSNETAFDITPSLRYAITQHCSVNVGYRYTDVKNGSGTAALEPFQSVASQSVASYTRSRYFAGITLSF